MRALQMTILSLVAIGFSGCSTIKETIDGPQLSPMGVPSAVVLQNQPVIMAQDTRPASSNTLWRNGARDFFNDQRAKRVGDILTVMIEIDDSAQTSNATSGSRKNAYNAALPGFLGLESSLGKILPSFDPANAASSSGSNSFSGSGSVKRAEKVSLTMAAMVTGVLPNGNLVIQGRQEVRTNNEMRELTVGGIVRPEDISSSNTILHSQLAEARISYGGRGDLSNEQRQPAAQSLMTKFSPF